MDLPDASTPIARDHPIICWWSAPRFPRLPELSRRVLRFRLSRGIKMTQRKKLAAAAVALVALAGGQLAAWTTHAGAEPRNPGIARLQDDATAGLRIERNASGAADFVGTTAGNQVVNP